MLQERQAIGWLRERDIDLLICAELHGAQMLHSYFSECAGLGECAFEGAWASRSERDGETDLVLAVSNAAGTHFMLIENKIAASFQRDQGLRYQQRALRWREEAGVTSCQCVLLAPRSYLERAVHQGFDLAIAYEEIVTVMERMADARSIFSAIALRDGISAAKRGYVMEPDEPTSDLWRYYWSTAMAHAPALKMPPPNEKPSGSNWIYFREADGLGPREDRRAVVVHKAERGQVDLQFWSTSPADLHAVASDLVEPDMQIVKAGKSASIRVSVPAMIFSEPPENQEEAILEGIRASERMRLLFIEYSTAFLRLPVFKGYRF